MLLKIEMNNFSILNFFLLAISIVLFSYKRNITENNKQVRGRENSQLFKTMAKRGENEALECPRMGPNSDLRRVFLEFRQFVIMLCLANLEQSPPK